MTRKSGVAVVGMVGLVMTISLTGHSMAGSPDPEGSSVDSTPVPLAAVPVDGGEDVFGLTDDEMLKAFPFEFASYAKRGLDTASTARYLRMSLAAPSLLVNASQLPGYSGFWIDTGSLEYRVGLVPGPEFDEASAAVGRLATEDAPAPKVVAQRTTYAELREAARALQDAVREAIPDHADVEVAVDEVNNRIVIGGFGSIEVRADPAVANVLEAAPDVEVVWTGSTAVPLVNVPGGWREVGPGSLGPNTVCSMGFTALKPSATRAVMTADHCELQSPNYGSVTLGGPTEVINGPSPEGDVEYHVVPSGHSTVGTIENPGLNIRGTFFPVVGSAICYWGTTSGGDCGSVYNILANDTRFQFTPQAQAGDSGGPVYLLNRAAGLVSSGTAGHTTAVSITDMLSHTDYFLQKYASSSSSPSRIGIYHPVTPTRVVNGVTGSGTTEVNLSTALSGYNDVGAVALSVTAVPTGNAGYLRVYTEGATGVDVADLSNVNFDSTHHESNFVMAPSYNKRVQLYRSTGVKVYVDLVGYWSDTTGASGSTNGGRIVTFTTAQRLTASQLSIPANGYKDVQVAGEAGVSSTATGAVLNIVVNNPSSQGYLVATAGGGSLPGTSNINFYPGEVKARLIPVQFNTTGKVRIYNSSSAAINTLIDVQGYFAPSSATTAYGRSLAAEGGAGRIVSNRAINAGTTYCIDVYDQVATRNGAPHQYVGGLWLNVTVTQASQNGYIVVYPEGGTFPSTSNLNYQLSRPVTSNAVLVRPESTTNGGGGVCFYSALGNVHLYADLLGYTRS